MKEHGICAKCKKSVGCPYADDRITGCKNFMLEYELELTNKEWFNSLALDTKAYWLANTCRKAMWEDKYDNNDEKSTLDYRKERLKKPHND